MIEVPEIFLISECVNIISLQVCYKSASKQRLTAVAKEKSQQEIAAAIRIGKSSSFDLKLGGDFE